MNLPSTEGIENVTVFSDASYCPETHSGGGAFWARSTDHKHRDSFELLDVFSSSHAEVATALMSMLAIQRDTNLGKVLKKGRNARMILVIDCLDIKNHWESGYENYPEFIKDLYRQVKEHMTEHGYHFKINHVKAHSGIAKARNWVNDWCDRAAKHRMRKRRSEIRRLA